ncbi:PREDICTED: uncharacterized protein LOC108552560, partial [Eufriesea mexicana]|uniref:uncharacterized protein LOC108552560 n=1 Tax=Eufriesea mexicana TaxID=516756 RepID=UPI00083BD055
RITGLRHCLPFHISPKIIERRKQFWDQFFEKYIDQTSDTTEFKIVLKKEPVYNKSLDVIQYWVDTGYLPYTKFRMDENKQSDIGSLITAKCISSSPSSCNNSSSSSVDTAAYILSNMNTTNKAETMAIVEGAKDDKLIISQNTQNTKITEPTIDKVLESSTENIVVQRNLDANVNKDILSNTVHKLTDDKLIDNNTPNYNKLMDERLMYAFDDSIKTNSYIKQNLLNMNLSHIKRTSLSKENFVLDNSIRKSGHHKKLYNSEDSPVDVIEMSSNNRSIISKLKQNLHPALGFGCKLSRKSKMNKKRRTTQFSIISKNLMNISQFSITSHNRSKPEKNKSLVTNNNIINNSIIDQHLVKCNTDQYMNRFVPINESTNKQDNLNKSVHHVDKTDIKKYKKSNDIKPKFKNLNPIVYLTQLSKDDIKTHKKSKILMNNRRKINTIQLSKRNMLTRRQKKLNKVTDLTNSNSTIRFDKADIQGYKRPNSTVMLNLNPLVHLKRLSEFEIKNFKILNARVLLNRLSKFDIERYTNVNNNKVISKGDILPTFIQMQDNNVNINDHTGFSASNCSNASLSIINLANEDTTSDQSTLLMRKCDSILFDNSSADNLSVFSKCSSQLYSMTTKADNVLETKKRFNEKGKESDKIESMIDKHKSKVDTEENYNTRNRKLRTDGNNNKKKPHTILVSDDDDEFVKLLHCSKDMQKLKLKQRYKEFYKNFNSPVKKTEDIGKCNNTNSSILLDQTLPKSIVEKKEGDPYPSKNKKFLQACNLSMEEDNQTKTKLLSNMNLIQNRNRFRLNHLCYKTKIIESDTESKS